MDLMDLWDFMVMFNGETMVFNGFANICTVKTTVEPIGFLPHEIGGLL